VTWEESADKLQACDMCRKKKIKCDGKMPSCTHCLNYKTECIFTQVEKKRQPPKGYVGVDLSVMSELTGIAPSTLKVSRIG
jgi:hypothetical protein